MERSHCKPSASSTAIIWIKDPFFHEVSVNGLRQGVTKKYLSSPKASVCICKASLFETFKALVSSIPVWKLPSSLRLAHYCHIPQPCYSAYVSVPLMVVWIEMELFMPMKSWVHKNGYLSLILQLPWVIKTKFLPTLSSEQLMGIKKKIN